MPADCLAGNGEVCMQDFLEYRIWILVDIIYSYLGTIMHSGLKQKKSCDLNSLIFSQAIVLGRICLAQLIHYCMLSFQSYNSLASKTIDLIDGT